MRLRGMAAGLRSELSKAGLKRPLEGVLWLPRDLVLLAGGMPTLSVPGIFCPGMPMAMVLGSEVTGQL